MYWFDCSWHVLPKSLKSFVCVQEAEEGEAELQDEFQEQELQVLDEGLDEVLDEVDEFEEVPADLEFVEDPVIRTVTFFLFQGSDL